VQQVQVARDRQLEPRAERAVREVQVVQVEPGDRLVEADAVEDGAAGGDHDAVQRLHADHAPRGDAVDVDHHLARLAVAVRDLPERVERLPGGEPDRPDEDVGAGDADEVGVLQVCEQAGPEIVVVVEDLDVVVREHQHVAGGLRDALVVPDAHRRCADDLDHLVRHARQRAGVNRLGGVGVGPVPAAHDYRDHRASRAFSRRGCMAGSISEPTAIAAIARRWPHVSLTRRRRAAAQTAAGV
jgi:hypothetical protein